MKQITDTARLTRMAHARSRRAHRRQRASAVILVVVSLVLMALIGAAYLQQTRVQRFTTAPPRGDIDLVLDAILAQIRQTLRDDLRYDDSGNAGRDTALELYDYPWTNPDAGISGNQFPTIGWDGSTPGPATGNYQDDMWLASSEPANLTGDAYWPHITNLNGLFLRYNSTANQFPTSGGVPIEDVVDFGNLGDRDATDSDSLLGLPGNSTASERNFNLVDVTGDGVPDSRWTWAPIQEIGGIGYVMAIRIVDLSGKINVNTATALTDTNGVIPPGEARWDLPTELDLGRFVYNRWQAGLDNDEELEDLLQHRLDGSAASVPLGHGKRVELWEEQGRYNVPKTGYRRYGLGSEYELRHRDGLNSGAATPVPLARLDEGMPQFLRGEGAGEETYYDHTDTTNGWNAAFYDGDYAGVYPDYSPGVDNTEPLQMFYELEPRKQLTTLSGASIFRWPLPGQTFAYDSGDHDAVDDYLKVDLNRSNRTAIQQAFRQVYATAADMLPGGFAADADGLRSAAAQFTANVLTHRTNEPYMIEVEPGDPALYRRYGLPPVPVVTEVYTQTRYEADSDELLTEDTNESYVPKQWEVTWTRQGETGYAIEIHNPFDEPVALHTIQLVVNGEIWTREPVTDPADYQDLDAPVMLSHLAAAPGEEERSVLEPGEVLVLYHQSDAGTSWTSQYDPNYDAQDYEWEPGHPDPMQSTPSWPQWRRVGIEGNSWRDNILEHVVGSDGTVIPVKVPEHIDPWPTVASGATAERDVTIELRSTIRWQDANGDSQLEIAPWPYFETTAFRHPDEKVETVTRHEDPAPDTEGPYFGYYQHSVRGGGEGLNPIMLGGDDLVGADNLGSDFSDPDDNGLYWLPGDPNDPNETAKLPEMQPRVKTGDTAPLERNGYASQLGHLVKNAGNYDSELDDYMLYRDRVLNGYQFRSVGDVAHLMVLGPAAIETPAGSGDWEYSTVAEEWETSMNAGRGISALGVDPSDHRDFEKVFMLYFGPELGLIGNPSVPEEANYAVPHAALLIDRFTTLSPVAAGVDDDEGGLIVPGLVNLNTMPIHLLDQVLPFDETERAEPWYTDLTTGLLPTLLAYRDVPPNDGAAAATTRSGLLGVNASEVRTNPGFGSTGELFALLDSFDTAGSDVPRDAQLRLARWLSQVGSARSDFFAAYIYVRGYEQGTFDQPVTVGVNESARVIAIFERNASDGEVRVVAIQPNPYEVR